MIILLSPAKKMTFAGTASDDLLPKSRANFLQKTHELIDHMRSFSRRDLMQLMSISEKLADLNYQRFQAFEKTANDEQTRAAIFAFNGDTYQGLKADDFDKNDLQFAQQHLRILSGLYGLLRPMDAIQPYRLEMGSKVAIADNANLYDFWQGTIAESIQQDLQKMQENIVINLASEEYFKAVHKPFLTANIITPHFKEEKAGVLRTIGLLAKRARGAMARFAIQNRITKAEELKNFTLGGYQFSNDLSDDKNWIFYRPHLAPNKG